jgi:hypothetical protein
MGEPGMPILVRDVVQAVAEVRKTTVEAITQAVQSNLIQLIQDDPWLVDTYARVLGEQHDDDKQPCAPDGAIGAI